VSDPGYGELCDRLLALDKRALGQTVTLFEDSRAGAAGKRRSILAELDRRSDARRAFTVGVTGAPGVGKSTLVGELALRLAAGEDAPAVAVLAVDPSSHRSGGALLGDRARVRFPPSQPRLFFRSQASHLAVGGLGRGTYPVSRLLVKLFDYLIVETVGVGQSEVEIAALADCTALVVQPMSGDQVQFMKAGIMEVPDLLLLNKSDLEGSEATMAALAAGSGLRRASGGAIPILRVSAASGAGVDELVGEVAGRCRRGSHASEPKESYFFARWVADEFGRLGAELLDERGGGAAQYLGIAGGFELAQSRFAADVRRWLAD
jgi:LAO/AO transport system kinase